MIESIAVLLGAGAGTVLWVKRQEFNLLLFDKQCKQRCAYLRAAYKAGGIAGWWKEFDRNRGFGSDSWGPTP